MVARRFLLRHDGEEYLIDYDTEDGFEVSPLSLSLSLPSGLRRTRLETLSLSLSLFACTSSCVSSFGSSWLTVVCSPQVLQFQIFSLTSVPPDNQQILVEEGDVVLAEGSDLTAVSDKLRLLSMQDAPVPKAAAAAPEIGMSDEELARLLQAEEEALYLQQFQTDANWVEFENRVRSYVPRVLLEAARKTLPVDEIKEKSLILLAKEGNFKPSDDEQSHAFLLELLFWFKQSFRWVNSPPCDSCGGETRNTGMGVPLPAEIQYGGSRVEIYKCKTCPRITRFPRYNDPLKLLETKRGRCGEWANCFTLYCRAFGYDSRLILDFTDHVWTECFSHLLGRWMHLDPCEGAYDRPLLYEKGWNKNLNYVIAISKDGFMMLQSVLQRRDIRTEAVVSAVLSDITTECRRSCSSEMISALKHRDQKEMEELETNVHLKNDSSLSLPGRQSGAKEWRIARAEWGSDEQNSPTGSSCPPRKCVDNHVTTICSAFSLLVSHLSKEEVSKLEAARILKALKQLLLDLRASPFKQRKAFLDSQGSPFFRGIVPPLSNLLEAISLKGDVLPDGRVSVYLAGDPVLTALALPVALDVIEEMVNQPVTSSNPGTDSFLRFSKSNRISSGMVLASGEELPFGIATAAFDGVSSSKWEEPVEQEQLNYSVRALPILHVLFPTYPPPTYNFLINFSTLVLHQKTGCWLIYRVTDGKMYNLEEYELMSANDAPERDPYDWILEGSRDGGSSWTTLDSRNSQIFEGRFQRKLFKIDKTHSCNSFRFRFLRVRDPEATSRFQIGSIDLFGDTH
ncbi:unnamed protein product [Spirodela intermedia]|uniref:Transglutaminase-like domain-containing protein n=1 Tax=Spirodela intermedia TaxID=51605 RepID=A0A7I8JEV9_SPIIN|nr:unnamed protein product [Spirodela intermedia]CAA6668708.1 unnamed protein product [Spirodela intermedia]